MLAVVVDKDKDKIQRQIQALQWQIKQDISEKDKIIHQKTLSILQEKLNK